MLSHNIKDLSNVTYTWCYRHNIFSEEELVKIRDYCSELSLMIGLVQGKQINESIRRSNIAWIERTDTSAWFFDRIAGHIDDLNKQFYGYDLWGYDYLQFSEYSDRDQGKYDFHTDMSFGIFDNEGWAHARKLSASLLLNDDFLGGELEINTTGDRDFVKPHLNAGTLIVFPSFLLHRVKQVMRGTRHSLVAWALGPKFR